MQEPKLSREQLSELLPSHFPEFVHPASGITIEEVSYGACRIRQTFSPLMLRPGGTISGPTMMGLTDFTMYVALLSAIGWVPMVVTSQLNINFLRKPQQSDLIAAAKLMKLGQRLAFGEVAVRSAGADDIVAHATLTYAIPSQR